MNGNEMMNQLALNTDIGNGKHLFGSFIGEGSWIVIGAVVGLAVLAAVVIFLRKRKKANQNKNEND